MKRIAIDFARPYFKQQRRWKRFSMRFLVFAVLGALLLAALSWECWSLRQTADFRQRQIQQLHASLYQTAPPPRKAEPVLSPGKKEALNTAIQKLNLPWRDLLNVIEKATPKNVALLSLEPEAEKNTLLILAESADPESMLNYIGQLKVENLFTDVRLIKHEINKQDPYTPYRFQIEAHWREAAL